MKIVRFFIFYYFDGRCVGSGIPSGVERDAPLFVRELKWNIGGKGSLQKTAIPKLQKKSPLTQKLGFLFMGKGGQL